MTEELTAIISDLHGINPIPFLRVLRVEGVSELVCLGDLDDPFILRDLMKLEMKKIILRGNHDDSFARGQIVYSNMEGFDGNYWLRVWEVCPSERTLALGLPDIAEERIGERRVVYVHGSLSNAQHIEGRMKDNSDKRINFDLMKQKGFHVLFRGHDHEPEIVSVDGNNVYGAEIRDEGWNVRFEAGRRYIVTVGAFFRSYFALFNKKDFSVKIEKIMGGR